MGWRMIDGLMDGSMVEWMMGDMEPAGVSPREGTRCNADVPS
jgi:hypothetical protein